MLAELVGPDGTVDGVEVVPALAHEADRVLGRVTGAVRPRIHVGDGRDGFPAGAPFDRILVSCATSTLFDAWRSQLAPGGRLVAPLGDAWGQELVLYRGGDPPGSLRRGPECLFVPLRGPLSFDI